jgi:hypothetical protein
LIVKQSIDAVPRKIFARLAAGTGTISQDGFSQPALGLDPRVDAGFRKDHAPKELDHDPIQFDRIMVWSLR